MNLNNISFLHLELMVLRLKLLYIGQRLLRARAAFEREPATILMYEVPVATFFIFPAAIKTS